MIAMIFCYDSNDIYNINDSEEWYLTIVMIFGHDI